MTSPLRTMIRDLHRRRGRERRSLALAEGVRLVEEALDAGVTLRGAAISPALEATTRGRALKSALERRGVRVEAVSDAELDELADTEHPQGVVAVVEPRPWALDDIAAAPGSPVLILDGVQDPGNVGTILRSALGLGAAGVIALKGTADLTNPKVVRGSMGALFRLPAVPADVGAYLAWAAGRGIETWVTAADGTPIEPGGARSRRAAVGLVLGNEGAGVSPPLEAAAARRVAIRLAPGVDSLNVAVAAAILLREVARVE
ncbi:MAG: TrmH family RNA methyltransferase [Gemmatimonadales bacterium]